VTAFAQQAVTTRFGTWFVRAEPKIVMLGEVAGRLGISCSDRRRPFVVLVRVTDASSVIYDKDRQAYYFHFTLWADGRNPLDLRFYAGDVAPATKRS